MPGAEGVAVLCWPRLAVFDAVEDTFGFVGNKRRAVDAPPQSTCGSR